MDFYKISLQILLNVKNWIFKTPIQKYKLNNSHPIKHDDWNFLLKKYVNDKGDVNYLGFQIDRENLQSYLDKLSKNPPNDTNWSKNESLVYWINAYNAFTIELILKHYPVKGIREIGGKFPIINSSWDIKFFKINGIPFDLNIIEHEILRKEYNEPRIHFAIVCASISCPRLLNEAYTAQNIEEQLERQTHYFINNPIKNQLTSNTPKLSGILDWYKSDFPKEKSMIEFVNEYADTKINKNATVSYLEYDWNLNEFNS